jgi:ABC-2 type transport system ATP-binding protein
MLQRGGVYPGMSANEAVRLFAAYYPRAEDPAELIDRLGLGPVAATPWRRLSGGEQQRVSLALALVGRPEVAFLDEPTAGIDPLAKRTVRTVIDDLRARGACVVLTTHDLDEVEEVADRIALVDRGRLVASGTPAELMASGQGDEIRFGAPAGIDVAALAAHLGAPVTEDRPGEYLVAAAASPARVAAITAWLAERDLAIADLRAGRQTLEDVFLKLTGDHSVAAADHQPRERRRGRKGT